MIIKYVLLHRTELGGGVGGRGGDSSRQIQRMDRFCLVCTVFKKIEPMFNI